MVGVIEGVPQIHYARSGDADIAYQMWGEGPVTLVTIPPLAQNVELLWEWPTIRRMFERYGTFCRFLHFDKRGTGASDRTVDVADVDQRIDDLGAVMDHAGIDHAYLYGISEGGPMTLLYAASFPDRVDGIILDSSGARLLDRDALQGNPDAVRDHNAPLEEFARRWGTPESLTPDLFAPSLAGDPEFRRWHERYERQAATRSSLMTLMKMNGLQDAREVLPRIEAPVLLIHRVDDARVSIERARETAALLPNATLVEMPGADHFTYAADPDAVLDEVERFVTGREPAPSRPIQRPEVRITTLGRFAVTVDGREVTDAEWGSRRARQLLKRLAVAAGWPVTRDELGAMLWPDEADETRWRPRLSVQLSAVRRVLHGGVVADRTTVRLDLDHVHLDLVSLDDARSDEDKVAAYAGELLPDDRYEDWADTVRTALRTRFLAAAHRLVAAADAAGDHRRAAELAARIVHHDPFDETAHAALVRALARSGARTAAEDAYDVYCARMDELGVRVPSFDDVLADR